MSSHDDHQSATLSAEDVRQWKNERSRLEARISQLTRKIEAAELLFPGIGSAEPVRAISRKEAAGVGSMGDAAKNAIREAGVPLAPPEIRRKLETSGFAEQLGKNPNYLYTVIFRLFRRGELVRDGERYRLPDGDESPMEVAGADHRPRELTLN